MDLLNNKIFYMNQRIKTFIKKFQKTNSLNSILNSVKNINLKKSNRVIYLAFFKIILELKILILINKIYTRSIRLKIKIYLKIFQVINKIWILNPIKTINNLMIIKFLIHFQILMNKHKQIIKSKKIIVS